MRHAKAELLLRLALDLQGTAEGMTLDDIRERYGEGKRLSRRTAERLRDAAERLIPQLEQANPGEVPKRWRIPGGGLGGLAQITAPELAALQTAIKSLDKRNMSGPAKELGDLHRKLAAQLRPDVQRRLAPDADFLANADGLATHPGPHVRVPDDIIAILQNAMLVDHCVKLHYLARETGKKSHQLVAPYGFLYGHRPYLVAYNLGTEGYRLFSLANVLKVEDSGQSFKRDPKFTLTDYASHSFGVYQEKAVDVVWRFKPEVAQEARHFVFHPSQKVSQRKDGSLIVRFQAGGLLEMCWHLFVWGDGVEIIEPKKLRILMKKELQRALSAIKK